MSEQNQSSDKIIKIIIVFMIAFLTGAIIFSLFQKKDTAPITQKQNKTSIDESITVSALLLTPSSIESTIKLNGEVSSQYEVTIYPDTSGKITSLNAKIGDFIQKNTKIASVDPSKPGSSYIASPIISTVTGTIIDIPIKLGDTVSTGTAIATIGSISDVEITVHVSEKYSTYLKKGLQAYIELPSLPEEQFLAKVVQISPVVNKTKRTIEVTLQFTKKDSRIKPGMFCSLRLVIKKADNTIVIPRSALLTYNAEPVVYTIDADNIVHRKKVTTGLSNDTQVEITSGLTFGETIVTAGSVYDGSKVRIAQSKESTVK